MVEWLAGNRIRGTSTERTTTTGFNPVAAVSGGWVEVGRTTLGSAGDTITVSGLSDKRYHMFLVDQKATGNTNIGSQFNADTGTNYSTRASINGASDATSINSTSWAGNWGSAISTNAFHIGNISNLSTEEKLTILHSVYQRTAGAGTSPERQELVGKWTNTSASISSMLWKNTDSGSYDTGSELVVLGWDDSDTHTTNFWEELDSVTLSSTNANLASNTFTAKKYLWIQMYLRWDDKSGDGLITFNGDTGTNYSDRHSYNGGSDATSVSSPNFKINSSTIKTSALVNIFTVNNSANEKLSIMHVNGVYTAGAGTAPDRRLESVSKWANTSSQITSMNVQSVEGGAVFNPGTTIKVWGSD